jgi:hypothetical protein
VFEVRIELVDRAKYSSRMPVKIAIHMLTLATLLFEAPIPARESS